MRCDVLPISALAQRELSAWEQLGTDAVVPNPFAEPAFVIPATHAWGVRDLQLLVVRDGAEWLAALPVRHVRSWRGVPGRCLAGWRHAYCYLGMPLVVNGDAEAILANLFRGGLRAAGCLALDWIDVNGLLAEPMATALASESRTVVFEEFDRAAMYRRESPDYLEQTLSARHRKEHRRRLRVLEREVGELTLRDDSNDPGAFERFLELERSGWKGEARTAMACVPRHAEFFTAMSNGFARSRRFVMLSLASEHRIIAMRCELLAGDMSFAFKCAFDEQFARSSPGIQLEIASMQRFHASGLAWIDSCADAGNATLNGLWFGRRRLRSVVATPRQVSGAAAYAKWRAAAAALPIRRKLKAMTAGLPVPAGSSGSQAG